MRAAVPGLVAVIAVLAACDDAVPPDESCTELSIVDLAVRGPAGGAPVVEGKATLPLTATATIPCIRGGAHASVTTSSGTLDDKPGATVVSLAPVSTDDTRLEGYATLVLDPVREARVNVQVGERVACRLLVVTHADDGTPVHVDDAECGAR